MQYVVIFNRDLDASEWQVIGPFNSQTEAGEYAMRVYRETAKKWIVEPILDRILYN